LHLLEDSEFEDVLHSGVEKLLDLESSSEDAAVLWLTFENTDVFEVVVSFDEFESQERFRSELSWVLSELSWMLSKLSWVVSKLSWTS